MQNEDKLIKQIDAMTYNARQAINALNRSVMKAGSYNGFTVERAGETVTLDRADIYKLYKFYEEWEYRSGETPFAQDMFDTAMEQADIQVGGPSASEVLVKHAKILYKSATNAEHTDDQFWLGKIKNATNPKLVSNSAPIPLNFRAPIYDENLSTKHYSQYETYLFPAGYNSIDLLGFQGDGTDHLAGGLNWRFEIDDTFTVNANKFLFGTHRFDEVKAMPYTDYNERFAFMTGVDCYGYGPNTFAGGHSCVSYLGEAFSYGYGGVAYGEESATIASLFGYSLGTASFTEGGYIHATADFGAAFNYMTQAGGYRYKFTTFADDDDDTADSGTECQSRIVVDGCTYTRATGATVSKAGLAPNQIRIAKDEWDNGMHRFYLSVGDSVYLYNWETVGSDGKAQKHNSSESCVLKPFVCKITEISSNGNLDKIISLDKNVTNREGFAIAGGSICAYQVEVTGMNPYNAANWTTPGANSAITYTVECGRYSAALNYQTTAMGMAQTVVGANNVPMLEPRFIVGCGYIDRMTPGAGSDFSGLAGRLENAFVAGPRYSFMKLANSKVIVGVSDHRNTADMPACGYNTAVVADEASKYGIYQLTGAYAITWDPTEKIKGISHVCYDRGEFSVNGDGLLVRPIPTGDRSGAAEFGFRDISTRLGGAHGSTVIWSGKDPDKDQMMWERYQYIQARNAGTEPINRVHIYGEDGITVETPQTIKMIARRTDGNETSYIDMDFERLILSGQTYGALAADCTSRSYSLRGDTLFVNPEYMAHNRESHSGFHFDWADGYLPNEGLPAAFQKSSYCDAYHSIVSSYVYSTTSTHFKENHDDTQSNSAYDVAGFILPGALTDSIMRNMYVMPRVQVFSNTIFGDGNGGKNPEGASLYEELAYMRDVDMAIDTAPKERVGTGTYCRVENGVVKTNDSTASQTIPAYVYDNKTGIIKKTVEGVFTTPWLSGGLDGTAQQQVHQMMGDYGIMWNANSFGYCLSYGKWGMPLLDKLCITLTGHIITVSFNLNLTLLQHYCGTSYYPAELDKTNRLCGLRLPIYPSIGDIRYLDNKYQVPMLTGGGPYGYRSGMTVSAYFPTSTSAMVLDIQWTALINGGNIAEAPIVPITLQGPCAFAVKSSAEDFLSSHHSSALSYWDGKTAVTDAQIRNVFRQINFS